MKKLNRPVAYGRSSAVTLSSPLPTQFKKSPLIKWVILMVWMVFDVCSPIALAKPMRSGFVFRKQWDRGLIILRGIKKMFIKWVGSKRRYLPDLVAALPPKFNRYFEPFLGSGALFFELSKMGLIKEDAFLSDTNPHLIAAYNCIKDRSQTTEMLNQLDWHKRSHSAAYYQKVRSSSPTNFIERASRFLYLNRTAYSGTWRENKKGEMNAPMKKEEPSWVERPVYSVAQVYLRSAHVFCQNFETVQFRATTGDLVYFDPPYSETCCEINYQGQGFTTADQIRLKELVDRLTSRGVDVMVSNSSDQSTAELWQNYYQKLIPVSYRTNGKAIAADKFDLLITNY